MLQRIFGTGIALLCLYAQLEAQNAPGADSTASAPKAKTTISGAADVYYRYDLGKTAANNRTSFTNSHNSFELGMISLKAEHSIGKVGMVADIGFGKRAEEFSYADDRTRFIIKQLYLSYTTKYDIKLTAGSWATHIGYELVDASGNRDYSMSYMFSYGPFFHTGLKAEKSFGKTGIMLGVANPTDLKSTNFKSKYVIGQISTASKNDKTKLWLNYQGGKPNDSTLVNQVDLVALQAISEKWSMGLNGTMATFKSKTGDGSFGDADEWWGAAVYINADPISWLGFTLRSEYFSDAHQLNVFSAAPAGGHVIETTLSANFKAQSLTLIPEIRFEKASESIFYTDGDQSSTTATSFLIAAVYKF